VANSNAILPRKIKFIIKNKKEKRKKFMNYIVISPYYPHNFQKFSIELKKQGINVLGIGEEPYDQLDDRLKEALTEYFRVNSLDRGSKTCSSVFIS